MTDGEEREKQHSRQIGLWGAFCLLLSFHIRPKRMT
jgi:hypothetical protein